MIKSKMRITPGSILPYFSALLILVSIAGYFLCWQVSGSWFRFRSIADQDFDALKTGELLQVGGMILLLLLLLIAAKEQLWILALPILMYLVGTVFLTLENSEAYYSILVIGLIFFWFFVVTAISIFHSKWPLCIITILALAAIGAFCIMGKTPFLVQIEIPGEGMKDFYNLSFLMRVAGYYGGMLLLSLAIGKKYNMDTITATTGKVFPEDEKKEAKTETEKPAEDAKETGENKQNSDATPVEYKEIPVEKESITPEPAITVPVSGSRLQKVLKEETVYDRDQRLMYKKKLNTFSIIGLILSVLTIILGVIIIFQMVDIPALKNDVLGIPMVAMGLFMCCLFGTRMTYKEYYTQTVVTERKVMREETNWEEVLASRLEEDEQSIALLSENYSRMTELYGKLLENTTELMKHVNLLGEYEQKLNLPEEPTYSAAAASEVSAQEAAEEDVPEEYVPEEYVPEEYVSEGCAPEEYEQEPVEESAQDDFGESEKKTQYFDLESQIVFDTSFLSEESIEKAFMDIEASAEEEPVAEEPVVEKEPVVEEEAEEPFILPTFRGYEEEPELPAMDFEVPEEEPELSAMDFELPEEVSEEAPELPNEPGIPEEEETDVVEMPVPDAEERRRKLQERLMEIQRRNREKINQLNQQLEDWKQ